MHGVTQRCAHGMANAAVRQVDRKVWRCNAIRKLVVKRIVLRSSELHKILRVAGTLRARHEPLLGSQQHVKDVNGECIT